MDAFDLINSIYKKQPMNAVGLESHVGILLNSWLRLNPDNLPALKKINQFLYYVTPQHYLILLFLLIPHRPYPPRYQYIKKKEKEENSLDKKLCYVLGWSKHELEIHRPLLDKVLDRDYWKKELAVKGD